MLNKQSVINNKPKRIKKESFRPDNTILNMSLKDAYNSTFLMKKDISVVLQNLLTKDINVLNQALSLTKEQIKENNDQKDSYLKSSS